MVNIFEYTDFRAYLQRCFEEKKTKNPNFSYQVFTRMVGFTNKGFIFNIIKGKRKLSKLHCYKFSKALRHTKEEADYFENIVAYSLATNDEERDYYYGQALQCKSGTAAPAYQLRKDQYEFYSQWYHSAIRALINLQPFKDDYHQLSQKLSPPITKKQAQKSVQLLERLGLISRGGDGNYHMTKTKIKTGDEISQTAKNRFHFECTELAKNSILSSSPSARSITSLTLGISERTYEMICKEEQLFKEKIARLANSEEKADRVYQYQLILFPLTQTTQNEDLK
jgi:uncharacterized protein (TIGR02147 family)